MATAPFTTTAPFANDSRQNLLAKCVYWAQKISEDNGGVPGTAPLPGSMGASPNDTEQVLLVKLAYWLASISAGL